MKRALQVRSAKRSHGVRILDLADSANLYLTPDQGWLYQAAIRSRSYEAAVLRPLNSGIAELGRLWAPLSNGRPLLVVDCGPATVADGFGHVQALSTVSEISRYVVVDVNSLLLATVASRLDCGGQFQVDTCCQRFEDLSRESLGATADQDVIFLLGSTAMNYEAPQLAALLGTMTRTGDAVSVEVLVGDGHSRNELLEPYESEAVDEFVFAPIALAGGRREDFSRVFDWNGDRVEFWFRATRDSRLGKLNRLVLKAGDLVLSGFSRRPSYAALVRQMKELFSSCEMGLTGDGLAVAVGRRG